MRVRWASTPEQLKQAFDGLAVGLNDWSPAMIRMRHVLAGMFSGIFGSSGASLAGAWEPLSAETVRRKLRAGGSTSPATLRATGALEASLTSDAGTDGSIRRVVAPGQGVPRFVWGTRLPYAAALQFGEKKKRSVTARPFVGITDAAQDEIRDILQETLTRRLAETAAALGRKA